MTTDHELEGWRREWRHETEPLPDLKKKIRRQNLWMAGAVAATCICLAASTVEAVRTGSSFVTGLAVGIGFASVVLGSYGWWVRRGAWKPTAQTTLAYAELSYKRAVAKWRTVRFAFFFLLATASVAFASAAWYWKHLLLRDGVILAALVIEVIVLWRQSKRKKRAAEKAKELLDELAK